MFAVPADRNTGSAHPEGRAEGSRREGETMSALPAAVQRQLDVANQIEGIVLENA